MRFGDVIISVTLSTPKCSQTGSQSVIIRRRRNTGLFFFSKLIVVQFGLKLDSLCNSDSYALWNDRLTTRVTKINPLPTLDMSMRNRTFIK